MKKKIMITSGGLIVFLFLKGFINFLPLINYFKNNKYYILNILVTVFFLVFFTGIFFTIIKNIYSKDYNSTKERKTILMILILTLCAILTFLWSIMKESIITLFAILSILFVTVYMVYTIFNKTKENKNKIEQRVVFFSSITILLFIGYILMEFEHLNEYSAYLGIVKQEIFNTFLGALASIIVIDKLIEWRDKSERIERTKPVLKQISFTLSQILVIYYEEIKTILKESQYEKLKELYNKASYVKYDQELNIAEKISTNTNFNKYDFSLYNKEYLYDYINFLKENISDIKKDLYELEKVNIEEEKRLRNKIEYIKDSTEKSKLQRNLMKIENRAVCKSIMNFYNKIKPYLKYYSNSLINRYLILSHNEQNLIKIMHMLEPIIIQLEVSLKLLNEEIKKKNSNPKSIYLSSDELISQGISLNNLYSKEYHLKYLQDILDLIQALVQTCCEVVIRSEEHIHEE